MEHYFTSELEISRPVFFRVILNINKVTNQPIMVMEEHLEIMEDFE